MTSTRKPGSALSLATSLAIKTAVLLGLATNAKALPLSPGPALGVSWGGFSYEIDVANGTAVQLRRPDRFFNAMAGTSTGGFFASDNSNRIYSINPSTGAAQLEASITGFDFSETIRGMAFSSDNRLYAIVGTPQGSNDRFFEIHLATGDASLIGDTGMLGLQSLAVAPDGVFYSFEILGTGLGLATINPRTGLATDVNPLDDDQGSNMQSLAFSHDGMLYGIGQGAIYTVDLSDGALTQVAPFSVDIRGMEFLPVPEPSPLCLLLMAFSTVGFTRVK